MTRDASETITGLLNQVKDKVTQAQNAANDDERGKIQADVEALTNQVSSVVSAAQFNGQNLIDGSAGTINVLSSLDRDSDGNVSASQIGVASRNLSTGGYTAKAALTGTTGASATGDAAAFSMAAAGGTGNVVVVDPGYAVGDSISVRIGENTVTHTFTADDLAAGNTPADVAATSLKGKIDALNIDGLSVAYSSATAGTLAITNGGTADLSVNVQFKNANAGGLGALGGINVGSATGATAALGQIDTLIKTAIDAAAAFGTVQNRLEIQNEFVGKLTDNLKAGIGSMVDADMEEASARLQALQTQQQLGVQSLSIANQAPQSVLSLFR